MKTVIQRLSPVRGRRMIAISDIHGHAHLLDRLLDKLGFCSADILFIVGDIIQRGPDNLGTLRMVMELSRTHEVYACMGNWEAEYVRLFDRADAERLFADVLRLRRYHPSNLMDECCRELGLPLESEADMRRALPEILAAFAPDIDFMRRLPTLIDTPDYLFVHGGVPTEDLQTLSAQDGYQWLKNNAFMRQGYCFSKYVVVGHWPVTLYCEKAPCYLPRIDRENRIIGLDGGCGVKHEGQLNALIIDENGEFSSASCDDFPLATALDAQRGSDDPVSIHWGDAEVRVLDQSEEFAQVEHVSTGRRMEVPVSYLYEMNGAMQCEDCTDNELQLACGEQFSVLLCTSHGVLARKNGICGWYRGRFAETHT